jgi:hypothetical protein
MNILGDFLAECTKVESAPKPSAAFSRAYCWWCEENGERAMSATSLGMRLKERGLVQQRIGHKKVRTWMDIELIQEESLRLFRRSHYYDAAAALCQCDDSDSMEQPLNLFSMRLNIQSAARTSIWLRFLLLNWTSVLMRTGWLRRASTLRRYLIIRT